MRKIDVEPVPASRIAEWRKLRAEPIASPIVGPPALKPHELPIRVEDGEPEKCAFCGALAVGYDDGFPVCADCYLGG